MTSWAEDNIRAAHASVALDLLLYRFNGEITDADRDLVMEAELDQARSIVKLLVRQDPSLTVEQALAPVRQPPVR